MSNGNSLKALLAKHPKLLGVLFVVLLFLSQATPVLAGDTTVITGP